MNPHEAFLRVDLPNRDVRPYTRKVVADFENHDLNGRILSDRELMRAVETVLHKAWIYRKKKRSNERERKEIQS